MNAQETARLATQLVDYIRSMDSTAVAMSGGVDSAVVAAAAFQALGDKTIAITGVGAAVSSAEANDARKVSEHIGIKHLELQTTEIEDPDYIKNDRRRCYYCKSTLYSTIADFVKSNGYSTLLSGTNLDDLGDYRPGLEAGKEHQVRTPLADLKISKAQVRQIAALYKLPVSDKPASPCLASRIAYGQTVTPERLSRIERAELFLHQRGFHDVRVRSHADELARIELHPSDFVRLFSSECQKEVNEAFLNLGFKFVTIDLSGRQSGSLNRALPVLQ